MRDLTSLAARLTDALAHFPTFGVKLVEPTPNSFFDAPYIFIFTQDEIVNGIVQWEYQEIVIEQDTVRMCGGDDRRDGSNLDFEARGNWFAVTAIVFAVLSGRE